MSELPLTNSTETSEYQLPDGLDDAENSPNVEQIPPSETLDMINDYKAEHGSVRGLYMDELVKRGFDPNTVLQKVGNERLDALLQASKSRYSAQLGTEQWKHMETVEARKVSMTDDEIDALIEAGADPQYIVDALQRTTPEDGVDNPSSARIAARIDALVEAGLPPAILAARLNPSWREGSKDQLAAAEIKWNEANRLKAVA